MKKYATATAIAALVAILPATTVASTRIPRRVRVEGAGVRIVGREIVAPVGGVPVPSRNEGVGEEVLTTRGEYSLTAVNRGGFLVVRFDAPKPARSGSRSTAGDPACQEGYYNVEGGRWTTTERWRYNWGTTPGYISNAQQAFGNVSQGHDNMTEGLNNCGLAEHAFSVHGDYVGGTNRYANIDSLGHCTGKFPDGENVVSWQQFIGQAQANDLAVTCFAYHQLTQQMFEADIAIRSNNDNTASVVDNFPSNCGLQVKAYYDLQSVLTHEWGHALGLAHENSGHDEVMYPYLQQCGFPGAIRHHLGRGDWFGLHHWYGG